MSRPPPELSLGAKARQVMRQARTAALGTALVESGEAETRAPKESPTKPRAYVSLVLACLDQDASPLLLLSTLAEHTRNLQRDPRVSLLFEATSGLKDPLTGARVTVLGRLSPAGEESSAGGRLMARFAARHPSAAGYAGFADFDLYRLTVERGHMVAGFGQINWIEAEELILPSGGHDALAAAEAGIVEHMNRDHGDAVALIARRIAGLKGRGWHMIGVDPEGADFRRGGQLGRVTFEKPVQDPESCRRELVRLTRKARAMAA